LFAGTAFSSKPEIVLVFGASFGFACLNWEWKWGLSTVINLVCVESLNTTELRGDFLLVAPQQRPPPPLIALEWKAWPGIA